MLCYVNQLQDNAVRILTCYTVGFNELYVVADDPFLMSHVKKIPDKLNGYCVIDYRRGKLTFSS